MPTQDLIMSEYPIIAYLPTPIDEKPKEDGCYMTKWKGVVGWTEKHFEKGQWQTRFGHFGLMTHWLKKIDLGNILFETFDAGGNYRTYWLMPTSFSKAPGFEEYFKSLNIK